MVRHARVLVLLAAAFVVGWAAQAAAENLLPDPSFEKPKPRDRWGNVFVEWSGFTQEGASCFEVGRVARTGETSLEIVGVVGGKIRMYSKEIPLAAGRYRLTLYVRGLDIGPGRWGTNVDLCVDQKNYITMKKGGTFGWTPLTYVFDAPEGMKFRLAFGLWEDGRVWVDDASLEKVANDVELTAKPVFGQEEKPVAMPGALPANPVRCPECGYRNDPAWGQCYACGAKLDAAAVKTFSSPRVLVFADFEDGKTAPFSGGVAVQEHATSGKYALRIDKNWVSIDTPQNWLEHDYLSFDVFNPQDKPVELGIEVRDTQTQDYWTRVNLTTIAPPGASVVTIPTALYVGEKSRPGRPLIRDQVNRFVVGVGDQGPLYFDNFRLERLDASKALFAELNAFQFKPQDAPKMEGFTPCGRGTGYSAGRGYGWTKADWWRDFNCLQPDLLYQSFVCPVSGTFRVDLPNGKYRVWMNIDSPGGFWGETQTWTFRKITANGDTVVDEKQDYDSYLKKYFRNASREDLPGIDTFKEYVSTMFHEKAFDVDVEDGRLELGFTGSGNWAFCLSAIVLYPDAKKAEGEAFLKWVSERRKKQFDDYFKQMTPLRAGAEKPASGCRVFETNPTQPVGAYDGPKEGQELKPGGRIAVTVAKGEEGTISFAVQPSGDLGTIDLAPSKLTNAEGKDLAADALQCGWFDFRISRVQMDGSVYTVAPRYWHPVPAPASPGVTRNFFIRVKTAADAAPGDYRGFVRVKPSKAAEFSVPVQVTVLPFALDPITDVAAGPWGCSIGTGWPGNDPANRDWNEAMFVKALDALKALGCSSFSGVPTLSITAAGGEIKLNTAEADKQMERIRAKGFTQIVSSYGASVNAPFNLYNGVDDAAAKKMGFADAQALVTAVWKAVDDHAVEANWVPVAYCLCDEPIGAALPPIIRNAKMHKEAAKGLKRTTFMGATSMNGNDPKSDHYDLVRSLPMPSLNGHDEASLAVIHDAGGRFSFYNDGKRWTYGRYMKALVVKHHLELRNTWHYNVVAGDPYYALDCREDDYCWFNTNEKGEMIPSTSILCAILPGLNDYRYLSTLQRLVKEKAGAPAAAEAKKVFDEMVDLKAGTDRDRKADFDADRAKVVAAIQSLLR